MSQRAEKGSTEQPGLAIPGPAHQPEIGPVTVQKREIQEDQTNESSVTPGSWPSGPGAFSEANRLSMARSFRQCIANERVSLRDFAHIPTQRHGNGVQVGPTANGSAQVLGRQNLLQDGGLSQGLAARSTERKRRRRQCEWEEVRATDKKRDVVEWGRAQRKGISHLRISSDRHGGNFGGL